MLLLSLVAHPSESLLAPCSLSAILFPLYLYPIAMKNIFQRRIAGPHDYTLSFDLSMCYLKN